MRLSLTRETWFLNNRKPTHYERQGDIPPFTPCFPFFFEIMTEIPPHTSSLMPLNTTNPNIVPQKKI